MAKRKLKKPRADGGQKAQIKEWLGRIKQAEKIRGEADARYGYTRAQKMYNNDYDHITRGVSDTPIVPINEVYAFAKTFRSSVLARDPHLAINPKGAKSIPAAKIFEKGIMGYWRDLRVLKTMRRVVLDAIFAEGVVKVGYTAAFGDHDPTEGESPLEVSDVIKKEEIFVQRVSWRNFVRDPYAIDGLEDARWCAQEIIKPVEAVRNSSLYDRARDITANITQDVRSDSKGLLDTVEFVRYYEVWDRDTSKVYVVAEGHDTFLTEPKDWPYELEGFGFELLRFNDNPDETYAPNLIQSWENQLMEKIKIRAMQLDHIKRFNRQMSVEEGAMNKTQLTKLQEGRTGTITTRKKGTLAPVPVDYAPIQADIYAIENRIDIDKDNISGQPNAVRSAPQKTQSRTLGEIDRLISSFQARQSDPQALVEEFIAEIAYKLTALMKQFLDAPKFVRATQEEVEAIREAFEKIGATFEGLDATGFSFTKEQIQDAEFEIEVKPGSTLPLDKQGRIEAMFQLLKLGPSIGVVPGSKTAAVIGKNMIGGEFELTEVEQAYIEDIKQFEIQKTLARESQRRQAEAQKTAIERQQALAARGGQ